MESLNIALDYSKAGKWHSAPPPPSWSHSVFIWVFFCFFSLCSAVSIYISRISIDGLAGWLAGSTLINVWLNKRFITFSINQIQQQCPYIDSHRYSILTYMRVLYCLLAPLPHLYVEFSKPIIFVLFITLYYLHFITPTLVMFSIMISI